MGQKLFRSKPGFFRIGLTAADLKAVGTILEDREEWIRADMRGSRA